MNYIIILDIKIILNQESMINGEFCCIKNHLSKQAVCCFESDIDMVFGTQNSILKAIC